MELGPAAFADDIWLMTLEILYVLKSIDWI